MRYKVTIKMELDSYNMPEELEQDIIDTVLEKVKPIDYEVTAKQVCEECSSDLKTVMIELDRHNLGEREVCSENEAHWI